jgi:hypothetical protein
MQGTSAQMSGCPCFSACLKTSFSDFSLNPLQDRVVHEPLADARVGEKNHSALQSFIVSFWLGC